MNDLYNLGILAVEDEPALRQMLCDILRQAGFRRVVTAADCAQARYYFAAEAPDAVLLDIMLPDGDGFTLMEELRRNRDVPVLFLSARDADEDRLRGLGLGADDYISKPFLPRELVLRLSAVLRRAYAPVLKRQEADELRLGNSIVNWGSGVVTTCRGSQTLTAKEYALLKKLADNRGNIVTTDNLCRAAWGDELFGYENTLMVHIRHLREKIEENPSKPRWLITVRGLGYRLLQEDKA